MGARLAGACGGGVGGCRVGPWQTMKVFTDNLVVAYPLYRQHIDFGEPELGGLFDLFAHIQTFLATDGFFLRGAITTGYHYQDQDIAYGKALFEAVDLDKSGMPPRLVIGKSLEKPISKHLSWYAPGVAPHYTYLLKDSNDGQLFLNYLYAAFEHFPDGPIDDQSLIVHKTRIYEGLQEYQSDAGILEKYKWLASYHNYVCQTFADEYAISGYDADPEQIAISIDAQRVLDYLIPVEPHLVVEPPRPLDIERPTAA